MVIKPSPTGPRRSWADVRSIGVAIAFSLCLGVVAAGAWRLAAHLQWFDIATLFQPWLADLALFSLLLSLVLRRRTAAIVCGALFFAAIVALAPPLWRRPPATGAQGPPISVATFNVMYSNVRSDLLTQWVRASPPDVLALQEVPYQWLPDLKALADIYPYSARPMVGVPDATIEIFSRYPIEKAEIYRPTGSEQYMIEATLKVGDRRVAVTVLHPETLRSSREWRRRNLYLIQTAARTQWVATPDLDRIVMGDLNVTRWSPYFRAFLQQADLYDADQSWVPKPSRIFAKGIAGGLGAPVDHVLSSAFVTPVSCDLGPDLGSDHLPLVCRLALRYAP